MTATHEGRAFEGAFALLRDDALVTQLREDLTALLEHPLSDRLLSDADRAELRGTVRLVREGLDRVLSQRSRVTATLKEYIVSHDAVRDRELEQTLRQVESELMTWMATTGPRAVHAVPLLPARVARGPPARAVPRPRRRRAARRRSATADPADAPPVSLGELMAQGGPQVDPLRQRLDAALSDAGPGAVARASSSTALEPVAAPPGRDLRAAAPRRRPPGLASRRRRRRRAVRHAVRPDGTRRTFAVPRTPLPDPDLEPDRTHRDREPMSTRA